jgi:hypothetical protein
MEESVKDQLARLRVDAAIHSPPPDGLGFTGTQIGNTCEHHTDTSVFKWEYLQVLIFRRAFDSYSDIVGIGISADPWETVFGFRVFSDLCDKPLGELTPLQIVELMAERFGLPITVGDKTGKFFSKQEVEITKVGHPGSNTDQLIYVHNPSNRFYALTRAVEIKEDVVRIALLFAIDTLQYREWVYDH